MHKKINVNNLCKKCPELKKKFLCKSYGDFVHQQIPDGEISGDLLIGKIFQILYREIENNYFTDDMLEEMSDYVFEEMENIGKNIGKRKSGIIAIHQVAMGIREDLIKRGKLDYIEKQLPTRGGTYSINAFYRKK